MNATTIPSPCSRPSRSSWPPAGAGAGAEARRTAAPGGGAATSSPTQAATSEATTEPASGGGTAAGVCELVTADELAEIFGVPSVTTTVFVGPPDTCSVDSDTGSLGRVVPHDRGRQGDLRHVRASLPVSRRARDRGQGCVRREHGAARAQGRCPGGDRRYEPGSGISARTSRTKSRRRSERLQPGGCSGAAGRLLRRATWRRIRCRLELSPAPAGVLVAVVTVLSVLAACGGAGTGDGNGGLAGATDAAAPSTVEEPTPEPPAGGGGGGGGDVPTISTRSFVGGTAHVAVSGQFEIDADVAINTGASYADGGYTWLQFGDSGSEAPERLGHRRRGRDRASPSGWGRTRRPLAARSVPARST